MTNQYGPRAAVAPGLAEATDRGQPGWFTQRELARRLGINHNKVYLAIAQFRREN